MTLGRAPFNIGGVRKVATMTTRPIACALALGLCACGQPVPQNGDYWIEMKTIFDEWEKVILVTGYLDDYETCIQIIEAMSEWNQKNNMLAREYRCTPV